MSKQVLLLALLAGLIAICAVVAAAIKGKARRASGDIRAKKLLTEREQPMFFRLQQAFPENLVLCQVAFSSLVTAKDLATRSTFNRKVADFVLTTRAFEVIAVIELDDSSHKGRELLDSKRDALLERAGYRVLRYPRVPDVDALRLAVSPAPKSMVSPPNVKGAGHAPG